MDTTQRSGYVVGQRVVVVDAESPWAGRVGVVQDDRTMYFKVRFDSDPGFLAQHGVAHHDRYLNVSQVRAEGDAPRHTAGPWRVVEGANQVEAANGEPICQGPRHTRTQSEADRVAHNMLLIAAATDLYAAARNTAAYLNVLALRYCDGDGGAEGLRVYRETKSLRDALNAALDRADAAGRVVPGGPPDGYEDDDTCERCGCPAEPDDPILDVVAGDITYRYHKSCRPTRQEGGAQ